MSWELFHSVVDGGASARARTFIVEHGLKEQISFRNVYYAEVAADLAARGGSQTPALWDGARLVEGGEAVLAALEALASQAPGEGGSEG